MKKLLSNPLAVKFPFELLELARKENAYLSLFDRRVVWVKNEARPRLFDIDEPVILPVGKRLERSYIHGTRICGVDRNGWLLRAVNLPCVYSPSEDSDFSVIEGISYEV